MSTHATERVFSVTAATYDIERARLIPGFDRFYGTTVDLIPADADHILDLGAGTGLLSAFIREHLPTAHLHLIDNSAPMLDRAKARLADDRHITFELADYIAVPLPAEHYDAVAPHEAVGRKGWRKAANRIGGA